MFNSVPIGIVCPFAGQVEPISGAPNDVWENSACGSENPVQADLADAPRNILESQGWMLCDGRWLSATDYPELFAVLGFLYGVGTDSVGRRTFKIPDYRGLFMRGADGGAGMDPEAATRVAPSGDGTFNGVGSLQCDALQDHDHDYEVTNPAAVSQTGQAAGTSVSKKATGSPKPPARVSTETRSKNIAVSYIMKYR